MPRTEGLMGRAAHNALMASKKGNFKKFVASVVFKYSSIMLGFTSLMASMSFMRFTKTRFTIGSPTADSTAWMTEATAPAPIALRTFAEMLAAAAGAAWREVRLPAAPSRLLPRMAPDTKSFWWPSSADWVPETWLCSLDIGSTANALSPSARSDTPTSGKSWTASTTKATTTKSRLRAAAPFFAMSTPSKARECETDSWQEGAWASLRLEP
mmetsp:Transcript_13916/g.37194  ORF Transcript_13916/g.37194 Transcript_13916/m.37194 type:complete len:212 (-) Transcript_13916:2-637(-)